MALRADEQKRLLEVLAAATEPEAARNRMLVELLLGTGIRIYSALELDIGDIHPAIRRWTWRMEIRLSRAMNTGPSIRLPTNAFIFSLMAIGIIPVQGLSFFVVLNANSPWSKSFGKAGIAGKSAHSLRHSFATGLLARTGDLRLVQVAMNHASIVSTTIYVAVDHAKLRDAVGA